MLLLYKISLGKIKEIISHWREATILLLEDCTIMRKTMSYHWHCKVHISFTHLCSFFSPFFSFSQILWVLRNIICHVIHWLSVWFDTIHHNHKSLIRQARKKDELISLSVHQRLWLLTINTWWTHSKTLQRQSLIQASLSSRENADLPGFVGWLDMPSISKRLYSIFISLITFNCHLSFTESTCPRI